MPTAALDFLASCLLAIGLGDLLSELPKKPVAARRAVCGKCHRKDRAAHEKCVVCGRLKGVATRTESGKAICLACYRRSRIGKCARCKRTRVIEALGLCYVCYGSQ